MSIEETLQTLDGWHHAILDEEQAREALQELGFDKDTENALVENCTEVVKQGEDAAILHPVAASEKNPANGFCCQNTECPLPQGVWTKDWLYNVIPLDQVKFCPVCGAENVTLVHAYEKGEAVNTVNGNWLVGAIVRHFGLPTDSYMGRGYQHRENMRALRAHYGVEVQSGNTAK